MSEKLITPVDELTRLPLPAAHTQLLSRDDPDNATLHHAYHIDNETPPDETLADKAIGSAILYLMPSKLHNQAVKKKDVPGLHDLTRGPLWPTDPQEIAELLVFSHAGAITAQVYDLNSGNPFVRDMSKKERRILTMPAEVPTMQTIGVGRIRRWLFEGAKFYETLIEPEIDRKTYISEHAMDQLGRLATNAQYQYHNISRGYEQARNFLTDFLKAQDIASANPALVERFLATEDSDRRRFFGFCCIGTAIRMITDPMEARYTQVRAEGRLHPLAPEHARHKFAELLGTTLRWDVIVDDMESNLRNALGLAA